MQSSSTQHYIIIIAEAPKMINPAFLCGVNDFRASERLPLQLNDYPCVVNDLSATKQVKKKEGSLFDENWLPSLSLKNAETLWNQRLWQKNISTAILSKLPWRYGPRWETRTPDILLPKQARYQLR